MLVEIRVRDLGVIEDLDLVLGPGMTVLTGETGAGKTLVVEALELLVGGRADATLVRLGADQAVVEGRFVTDAAGPGPAPHAAEAPPSAEAAASVVSGASAQREIVVSREIPADGRSRAYVGGRMATVAALAEVGAALVDLHGQHSHQSLLRQETQREALDRYGGVDLAEVEAERATLRRLGDRLAELGGDERQLAREVDLLRYQVAELEAAALGSPDEEAELGSKVAVLSAAGTLRHAASAAWALLAATGTDDEGAGAGANGSLDALEMIGRATSLLTPHEQLRDLGARLRDAAAEIADAAAELRTRAEGYEDDPAQLEELMGRLRLLGELRRKYGDSLADVIEFERSTRDRLADLEAGESRRAGLESERSDALARLARAEEQVGDARRAAAATLASEIEHHLAELALPKARLEIHVPEQGLGDAVSWLFGANAGEPALPLAKVASGGELARAMLATRLVLSEAPPTLIFDEVDAGIGGEAALAVGRALHQLAEAGHQVIVVTHLAQVAAFADAHVAVTKQERRGRTIATVRAVDGEERLVELSRMLSGQPASATARRHAEELLSLAWG